MTITSEQTTSVEQGRTKAGLLLLPVGGALVVGVLAAIVVACGVELPNWVEGLRWGVYMLASAAIASILGLIFGVPRARTDFAPEASERYSANSNLEQISDWLTKLLVGVGLVELNNVPAAMAALGGYLGAGFRVPNASAFAASAVVYGAGVGFATGYLWTRLRLRPLLEQSDRVAAELSRRREQVVKSLRKAAASPGAPSERDRVLVSAADQAVRAAKATHRQLELPILWVDDHPENNASIVDALTALDIKVDIALSTAEAFSRLQANTYGLVITDLGRNELGEDRPMAGLELIQRMRSEGIHTRVAVFAGPRGMANRDALMAAGASMVSQRTSEIFLAAVRAALGLT